MARGHRPVGLGPRALGPGGARGTLAATLGILAVLLLALLPGVGEGTAASLPSTAGPSGLATSAPGLSCSGKLQALANASPAQGSAPFETDFSASACGGTPPYTYLWSFGDGSRSSSQDPVTTYAAAGTYAVSLEVNDSVQDHAWSNLTVTVQPTLGVAVSSTEGIVPLSIVFWANVTGTSSPATVTWQFGDGASGSGAAGSPVQHTYATAGNYTATATVTVEGSSWVGHGTETVHAEANPTAPPPLSLLIAPTPTIGTAPLALNVSASASGGTSPYALEVEFGDGGTQTLTSWSGATAVFPHQYVEPGSYTLTLSVTDAKGQVASSTASVFVEGPVLLHATAVTTVRSGRAPLTTSFLASASGGTAPYTVTWNFGDGTFGSGVLGVPVDHTYTSAGTYVAELTVTDAVGHSITVPASAVTVSGGSPSPGSGSGGSSGLNGVWDQYGDYIGGLGLVVVLLVVGLLEEGRRHREAESEARLLVEAMESAKGPP